MFNSKIIGFGKYLPENIVTNEDLSKIMDTSDEWIFTRTGIKERRFATTENTSTLCTRVAESILESTKVKPEEIDLIIVATLTPDYSTPSVACIVQKNIAAEKAAAFDLNSACSGFVYALSVADKFIKSGTYKKVLVLGGEVLSKTLDFSDRSTAVIFGDGAGGVLLEATLEDCGIITENLFSSGNTEAIRGEYFGVKNMLFQEDVSDKSKYLEMNGRDVLSFVNTMVIKNIKETLEKSQLNINEIKYVVPHQANNRISEIIAKKLDCENEKVYSNIKNVGNTSAGSIAIAFSELLESGELTLNSGENIIFTGFGSGLTCGTMVFRL